MSHYRIAFQKSLPGRQFTGKNPSRPSGRRVIISVIISPRADCSWGYIFMWHRRRVQYADWWEQYTWALFKALSHMLSVGFKALSHMPSTRKHC